MSNSKHRNGQGGGWHCTFFRVCQVSHGPPLKLNWLPWQQFFLCEFWIINFCLKKKKNHSQNNLTQSFFAAAEEIFQAPIIVHTAFCIGGWVNTVYIYTCDPDALLGFQLCTWRYHGSKLMWARVQPLVQTDDQRSSVTDLSITGLDIKYVRACYVTIISFFIWETDLCFFVIEWCSGW